MATDKVVHMYNTVVYIANRKIVYMYQTVVSQEQMVVILRWLQWLSY